MKKIKIALIFLTFSFFLFSESDLKEPSWFYLKNADNLFQKGEYSAALVEARKARSKLIEENLLKYYDEIFKTQKNKTQHELKKLVEKKRSEFYENDNYPQFHELAADIYVKTNFYEEAVKEYKNALNQKQYFEYPAKNLEIRYKLAGVYNKNGEFELEDIIYREITKEYFDKKNNEYWERIKFHITNDPTLNNAFKIYRIDGIEYLVALYKIGRRASILQRREEALFYLTNASLIWFTYFYNIVKKYNFDFKYTEPTDFLNYIKKIRADYNYNNEIVIDEIFFYIGYIYSLEKRDQLKNYFYNLALLFSKGSKKEEEIKNRINYFKIDKNYILKLDEIK